MQLIASLTICGLLTMPWTSAWAQPSCDLLELKQRFDANGSAAAETAVKRCVEQCVETLDNTPCGAPELRSLFLSFFPIESGEEDCQAQLRNAQKSYDIGNFRGALRSLGPCLGERGLRHNRITAHALQARVFIATDNASIERAVRDLVCLDPTYAAELFDPPQFEHLLYDTKLELDPPDSLEEAAALCPEPSRAPPPASIRTCPDCVWDVGIEAGFFVPDRDLSGKRQRFSEIEAQAGVRVGRALADRWRWFADALFYDINTDVLSPAPSGRQDASAITVVTGAEFLSSRWRGTRAPWKWFVGAGIGGTSYDLEFDRDVSRSLVTVSAGQRLKLDARARLSWALRMDRTLGHAGFGGAEIDSAGLAVGLTWMAGSTD